jgi:serine/threonine-protein kinase
MAMSADIIARKYRIVREIARSNDIVYEAIDATMGRRLAIKELLVPPNLTGAARDERIERFNREARAAGKLSHHNIVTVYDFGEDAGRYFIAMEYLEGGTLRDALLGRGALPSQEASDIASQVLAALAHAHANSVVHRDVKPDNIHLLPDGLVKLTDFGIARLTEEASLTGDGQVFGTPSYMSPEQIEGRYVDHRSDLFSLGVVLYEMVAGRKPFTGDSVVSITYAIMNAEPAPLTGTPYPLERLIARALSKDPSQRFQSAAEMRAILKDANAVPAMFLPPTAAYGSPAYGPGGPPIPAQPWTAQPSPWQTKLPAPAVGPAPTAAVPAGGGPAQSAATGAVVGPFATWGAQGSPPSQPPPACAPAHIRPPIIGEGTRTFFRILSVSFVLAAIVLGGVLLFVRSYEEHQRQGTTIAIRARLGRATYLANAGDYEGASELFSQVVTASPGSAEGRAARTSLATVWNRMGVRAAQLQRYDQAAFRFRSVLDLYVRFPDDLTPEDRQELRNAEENLRALETRGSPGSGPAGTAQGPDAVTAPSGAAGAPAIGEAMARELLEAGRRAYAEGDVSRARDLWVEAAGAAPGTETGRQAQQYLDRTTPPPSF